MTFKVDSAELAVTRFAADNAGSFLDNANRWRNQIGLQPIDDPQSVPMNQVKLANESFAVEVEFKNDQANKQMIVAMASAGGDLWFFKLLGPSDVVAAQKANFESFLNSVELTADAGKP